MNGTRSAANPTPTKFGRNRIMGDGAETGTQEGPGGTEGSPPNTRDQGNLQGFPGKRVQHTGAAVFR